MTPDQDTHHHPVVHAALDKLEDRADAQDKLISQLVEHNGSLTRSVTEYMGKTRRLAADVDRLSSESKAFEEAAVSQIDRLIDFTRGGRIALLVVAATTLLNAAAIVWLAFR